MNPDGTKAKTNRTAYVSFALAGGAILAISAVILFLFVDFDRPQEDLPELTREELDRDGDILRTRTEGVPFSGYLVSYYPDGDPRARSRMVEGRLHGLSEGWYQGGVPEVREEYREGHAHGVRVRWYPNGQMASRAEIAEGRLQGEFRRWREDGSLSQVIPMRDDQAHGVAKAFFPSGYLQARTEMNFGAVVRQEFWEDGVMPDEG